VVKGSHHCGRIEHGVLPGEQMGADPRRVGQIPKRLPVEFAEMEPGDGVFFHANVLHRSDQNRSEQRRWTLLHCYNAAHNNPYVEHHQHSIYTPINKVGDAAIKRAGVTCANSKFEFRARFANPPELSRRFG
jgi:ectoine hydroxylase-related dioxygenase (phytanoyl-CoA dioxygenase family)